MSFVIYSLQENGHNFWIYYLKAKDIMVFEPDIGSLFLIFPQSLSARFATNVFPLS